MAADTRYGDPMTTMGVSLMGVTMVLFGISMIQGVACDADPLYDFGAENFAPNEGDLVFKGYRKIAGKNLTEEAANVDTWPILKGLGIATRRLVFPPCGQVSPHNHPRATEICHVLVGELHVGLMDTQNKVYTNKLEEGDATVFPRGLMHWLLNSGKKEAIAMCSLNSANPGYNALNVQLFAMTSRIPIVVLESAFGLTYQDVVKVKIRTPRDDNYPTSGCARSVVLVDDESAMNSEDDRMKNSRGNAVSELA